jgi:hypothetical protein
LVSMLAGAAMAGAQFMDIKTTARQVARRMAINPCTLRKVSTS